METTSATDAFRTFLPSMREVGDLAKQSGISMEELSNTIYSLSYQGSSGTYRSNPSCPSYTAHKRLSEKEFMDKYSDKKTWRQRIMSIWRTEL